MSLFVLTISGKRGRRNTKSWDLVSHRCGFPRSQRQVAPELTVRRTRDRADHIRALKHGCAHWLPSLAVGSERRRRDGRKLTIGERLSHDVRANHASFFS